MAKVDDNVVPCNCYVCKKKLLGTPDGSGDAWLRLPIYEYEIRAAGKRAREEADSICRPGGRPYNG